MSSSFLPIHNVDGDVMDDKNVIWDKPSGGVTPPAPTPAPAPTPVPTPIPSPSDPFIPAPQPTAPVDSKKTVDIVFSKEELAAQKAKWDEMQTRLVELADNGSFQWTMRWVGFALLFVPFGVWGSFGIDYWSLNMYTEYQENTMMDTFYFFNNRTNYPSNDAYQFAMTQKKNMTMTNIYSWDEAQPINMTTLYDHIELRNAL